MSLSISLNNALTGLNVNQQALTTLSQNIANANTVGYSRQLINQQAVYLDGTGAGVSIEDVTRKVDEYLLRSVRLQTSVLGRNSTSSDYAERIQLMLGQPGQRNSISDFVTNFFSAAQALAQTPENTTQRVGVINAAASLTSQLNQLSEGLQDLRFQADQDIAQSIDAINHDIRRIHDLNLAIGNSQLVGKSVAGLLDSRDAALRDLSSYIDVVTYPRGNGQISLLTNNGVSLLDENIYQLSYNQAGSASTFVGETPLGNVLVTHYSSTGAVIGAPTELISGGPSREVTSTISSGRLKALLDIRDRQIPGVLDQLDEFAANLREEINAVHNSGISFPGANSHTGVRSVFGEDFSQWTGGVRIAVLDGTGQPVPSPYADETSGARPAFINLASLNSGNGSGNPSVQSIIDEINHYMGIPHNKAVVGNLNNIRLVSDSDELPGSPPQLNFDFDIENISGTNAGFFITDMQVFDSSAANITNITTNVPSIAINPTGGFETIAGTNVVTINTTAAHGLQNGDRVYLGNPGTDIDDIPAAEFNNFFIISNVTDDSFEITVQSPATAGGAFSVASQTVTPKYSEIAAGEYARTKGNGILTADLSGNSSSLYYTIQVSVTVDDGLGNLSSAVVSYRVDNNQEDLRNDRYSATAVSGNGTLVGPSSLKPLAVAMLVDENGVELTKTNGVYTNLERGFLKIKATNSQHVIAIDSLDSSEDGKPNSNPAVAGTGYGFSHYFGLNNFFESDDPATTTDMVTNAALNLRIESRLLATPNLISLGTLAQSRAPTDPELDPLYTYERNVGDNSIIQRMAGLAATAIDFAAAGTLGATSQTFGGYAGQIIGAVSIDASKAKNDKINAQVLLDGYSERADAISGVNLDEELANTIIYQNSYAASARIITVTSDLFETLINSF